MKKILTILLFTSSSLLALSPSSMQVNHVATPASHVVHKVGGGKARVKFMLYNKLRQPLDLVFLNKNQAKALWQVTVTDACGVEVWSNKTQLTSEQDLHLFSLASNKVLEKIVEIDTSMLPAGEYKVSATLLGNSKIHAWTNILL